MSAKDNFVQAFKELLSGGEEDSAKDEITQNLEQASSEPLVSAELGSDDVSPREESPVQRETTVSPLQNNPQSPQPSAYAQAVQTASAPASPVATPVAPVASAASVAPVVPATPIPEKKLPFGGFGGFGNKSSSIFGSQPLSQSTNTRTEPINNYQNGYGQNGDNNINSSSAFTAYEPPSGVTTIASGTVVIGEIHSKGDMNLFGEIKGNVETIGNITLGGRIMGNVAANDMDISTSAVKGNISASGIMSLDNASVILGDLKAREGQFDGQIKGNLTVEGLAHFMPDTVLLGNVTVGALIIDQGARLRGEICTGSRDRFDITDPFQGM